MSHHSRLQRAKTWSFHKSTHHAIAVLCHFLYQSFIFPHKVYSWIQQQQAETAKLPVWNKYPVIPPIDRRHSGKNIWENKHRATKHYWIPVEFIGPSLLSEHLITGGERPVFIQAVSRSFPCRRLVTFHFISVSAAFSRCIQATQSQHGPP